MDIGSLLQSVRQENISSPAGKGSGNAHKWPRTTNEAVSTETRSKWEEEELESLREARRKKGKDPVVPSKVINMIPSSFTLSIVPISEAVLVGRSFGIVQSFVSTFPSGSLKLVSSNEEQNIVFLWRAKLDRKEYHYSPADITRHLEESMSRKVKECVMSSESSAYPNGPFMKDLILSLQ